MGKKVRFCMIGAGRAGRVHINSLVRYLPEGEVVALVDPVPEALASAGEEFGIQERFTSLGAEVQPSSSAELGAWIRSDLAKWVKVVKQAGIKVEL